MVKVKICAVKSINDAKICIDAKADMIGVLVGKIHNSTDFVSKEEAKKICDYAKKDLDVVLVTHLTDATNIIDLTKYIGNTYIQLHSNIKEDEVLKIHEALPDVKLIRLIHIASDGSIHSDYEHMLYADYYLLDSFNESTNQVGGTGLTHDWHQSSKLIKALDKPVFLAGGLNPNNVKEAIDITNPYGVDVNTGCKNNLGNKDYDKVLAFIKNAKHQKKLVFDLDNTILFLSNDWSICYQSFIDANNLNLTAKELYQAIGNFEKQCINKVVTKKSLVNYLKDHEHINMTEKLFDDLDDRYMHTKLLYVDEIKELLEYLSLKYEIIAYTNWFTDNQIFRLKLNGLEKYFTKVYGWDKIPSKPSKEGILNIIKDDDIKDYTFIGDSIEHDIKLPKELGANVIYYNRNNINQNLYKEVKKISDLKNLL